MCVLSGDGVLGRHAALWTEMKGNNWPMIDYDSINAAHEGSETDTFTVYRYQQFARRLPVGARHVLDVGCNTGRGGVVLRKQKPELRLVGLDCVAGRLERLPQGVYSAALRNYSTAIEADDASFDAVVAGEFIEHLVFEDVDLSLREFLRVLRPGGRLLLTTPNPSYLVNKVLRRPVIGGAHQSEFEAKDLVKLLRNVGFASVATYGTGRVSRILGTHFPLLCAYGSYMAVADRRESE